MKTLCALLLTAALSLGLSVPSWAADAPETNAAAYVLMDDASGRVLSSKNPEEPRLIASTTKILTALLALEELDPDAEVVIDPAWTGVEGSSMYLAPGQTLTVRELLYGLLLASGNDAATALACLVSGSVETFAERMNERAAALGCETAHFENPSGLDGERHRASALDLAKILREAIRNEEFVRLISTQSVTVGDHAMVNHNRLLWECEGVFGGKTGYTEAAGHCLVSYAENDNMRLIAVVMGAGKKTGSSTPTDTLHFSESTNLYEWGFGNFSYQNILSSTELVTEVPVAMGKGKDSIILRPQSDITVIIDSSVPLDKISRDIKVYSAESEKPLMAPINAGDVLGEISLHYGGVEYGKTKLVASTNVALSSLEYLRSEIAALFSHTLVKLLIFLILVIFVLYIVLVIRYNKNRRLARQRAAERAQMARQEQLRREGPSTGKSFEDIEDMIQRREKSKK